MTGRRRLAVSRAGVAAALLALALTACGQRGPLTLPGSGSENPPPTGVPADPDPENDDDDSR